MNITGIVTEDFINFYKPSMFISTSKCSFKCDKECGEKICQNSSLAAAPIFKIDDAKIINKYLSNDITEAIVFGGLEPFDTFDELYDFIWKFRQLSSDTIVIYTGYYPSEIAEQLKKLFKFKNIIIKFGRFIPNDKIRHDQVLGITLSSSNQFAQTIEEIRRQMEG
jgi:organic radical activating enzyme